MPRLKYLGLSFYKSSALKEIRNKLEHERYNLQVKPEELRDLVNEIEKFEKEIYGNST